MLDPARFGLHLAAHLLARYGHLSAAFVTVEQLRWARIGVAGAGGAAAEGHKHAFWRDGAEKRFVEVEVVRKADGDVDGAVARVAGGLRDLLGALTLLFGVCLIIRSHALAITLSTNGSYAALRFAVLKSTGSAFENFVRDEYTTLGEVDDRIFSTSVDLRYAYGEVTVRLPRDEARLGLGSKALTGTGPREYTRGRTPRSGRGLVRSRWTFLRMTRARACRCVGCVATRVWSPITSSSVFMT